MTVWWAVGAAMRRQLERTLADRMVVDGWTAFGCDGTRLECPRHPATGGRPGAGEQTRQCADALDHGAGQPPHRGALVLAVGDGQGGRASALA